MQTATRNHPSLLEYKYLPAFAFFLLENNLDDFIKAQLRLAIDGFAICKKNIENYDVIVASGIPNKGETFTIIIPA